MKSFGRDSLAATVLTARISAAISMHAANRSVSLASTSAGFSDHSELERGKYMVEEVAKCPQCHTPRSERGELKAALGCAARSCASGW
jgi:hypothetical protein